MDKKQIGALALAALIGFMTSLGVNVAVNDEGYLPYTCDLDSVDDMMCYKLSRVGTTGVNRNCYYDRDRPAKYKVCSSGWFGMNVEDYSAGCNPIVVAYTEEGKFYCESEDPQSSCVNAQMEQKDYGDLE